MQVSWQQSYSTSSRVAIVILKRWVESCCFAKNFKFERHIEEVSHGCLWVFCLEQCSSLRRLGSLARRIFNWKMTILVFSPQERILQGSPVTYLTTVSLICWPPGRCSNLILSMWSVVAVYRVYTCEMLTLLKHCSVVLSSCVQVETRIFRWASNHLEIISWLQESVRLSLGSQQFWNCFQISWSPVRPGESVWAAEGETYLNGTHSSMLQIAWSWQRPWTRILKCKITWRGFSPVAVVDS